MSTSRPGLRDEVWGWTCEDPSLFVRGKMIGYTPSAKFYHSYKTVLEALADGWKLLGPPQEIPNDAEPAWDWWLVRDSK